MKRTQLTTLLKHYTPRDKQEIQYKDQMLTFIAQNPDCFERSLQKGHITASAWLLNNDGSKALLMLHSKLNKWMQLGGHCDGESDVLAVAIKEAQEESGIEHIQPIDPAIFDIDIHVIPARPGEPEHYHYDIRFMLQVKGDQNFVQNHESRKLAWFGMNKSEFPTTERSVTRLFDKWMGL